MRRYLCLLVGFFFLNGVGLTQQPAQPGQVVITVPKKPRPVGLTEVPLHPATDAQVRELLELTGFTKSDRERLVAGVDAQRKSGRAFPAYFPASFWDDLRVEVSNLDVASIYFPLYRQYLSEEDMVDILAFYHSHTGAKFIALQPLIVDQTDLRTTDKIAEVAKAVYSKHKEEIDAAKAKYQAEHGAPPSK